MCVGVELWGRGVSPDVCRPAGYGSLAGGTWRMNRGTSAAHQIFISYSRTLVALLRVQLRCSVETMALGARLVLRYSQKRLDCYSS